MEHYDSAEEGEPTSTNAEQEADVERATGSATPGDTGSSDYPSAEHHEGTVIFELLSRKVLRNGDRIVKINSLGIKASEAEVMRFVCENTTIPVPRVHATTPTSITMDYVEGTTLSESWNDLSDAERTEVGAQLRDYINQLRAIKGSYIGGFGRTAAVESRRFSSEGGPFDTEAEWNEFLLEGVVSSFPVILRDMLSTQLRTDHEIVLTHGDLHPSNIIVRDGRVVAIIDWERAGFYPEYLEFLRALRSPNWRVGYYSALLDIFPCRYDAEFLADQFLSRISSR
ncbi:kinase-like protein [Xylaria palmicola]|nr:kinase-like protein [Xylaria palmicola]